MGEESSDSNCSSNLAKSNKNSGVNKFKGVVPQQNGQWGAQIYANHHWIWLGTFKSEIDAAMAYDSAIIKLCSGDGQRNFCWTNISAQELNFQSPLSTDVVLNMIRDGSYPTKFAEFLKSQQREMEIAENLSTLHGDGEFCCNLLFEKELTPSDVGKLNRLVIPKRYAIKHFPNVPDPAKRSLDDPIKLNEVQLKFYDRHMQLWTFRYCYWKSSQSFVFTKGWNKIVKNKKLKARDTISFYSCESRDGRKSFLVFDVVRKDEDDPKEENTGDHSNGNKGFRLFGVQIE